MSTFAVHFPQNGTGKYKPGGTSFSALEPKVGTGHSHSDGCRRATGLHYELKRRFMTKSLFTIATLAVLLVFTSAYYTTPADGRVGYQAPILTEDNEAGSFALSQLRGNYVVVSFWSSSQPKSRISNLQLDRATRMSDIQHVSVNMDESEALYRQVATVDGLHSQWQWHCDSAAQDKLRRTWRQGSEYCSFLVDPEGRIIQKDPTPQDLAQL